jgi:Protein of unknown function (DUF998)
MRPDRRGLAAASIALSLAGVVSVVALHVLRPELAPLSHRLSEYAIGRYGGLMTAAFVCVGASLLMLAGALVEDDRRASARIVAAAVGVAGVGMMLSGVFRTDASRSGATADGLHSAASALATLALIGAAILRTVMTPRRAAPIVLATLSLALGAVSPALHRSRWTGLSQRLLWASLLAWVIVAAFELTQRHDASDPPGPAVRA